MVKELSELLKPNSTEYVAFQVYVKSALTDPNLQIRNRAISKLSDSNIGNVIKGYESNGFLYAGYLPKAGGNMELLKVCEVLPDKQIYSFDRHI